MTEHEFYRFLGNSNELNNDVLLEGIFGLDPKVDVEVKEFPSRGQSGKKDVYLRYPKAGLCLCLESDVLVAIEIYTKEDKNYKSTFQSRFPDYQLPHGILPSMSIKEVVQMLGEPDKKGSDRFLPIWISYDSLGVEINFSNSDWNDGDNQISYLSFYPPS